MRGTRGLGVALGVGLLGGCSLVLDTDELRSQDVRDAAVDAAFPEAGTPDTGVDAGPVDAGVDAWVDCSMWSDLRIAPGGALAQQRLVLPAPVAWDRSFTILVGRAEVATVVVANGSSEATFGFRIPMFQENFVVRTEGGCEFTVTDSPGYERELFRNDEGDALLEGVHSRRGNTDIANTGAVLLTRRIPEPQRAALVLWNTDGTTRELPRDVPIRTPRISDDGRLLLYRAEGDRNRFESVVDLGSDEMRIATFGTTTGNESADLRGTTAGYHMAIGERRDERSRHRMHYATFGLPEARAGSFAFDELPNRGWRPSLLLGEQVSVGFMSAEDDRRDRFIRAMPDVHGLEIHRPPCEGAADEGAVVASGTHVAFVGSCEERSRMLHVWSLDGSGTHWSVPLEGERSDVRGLVSADEALETFVVRSESGLWLIRRLGEDSDVQSLTITDRTPADDGDPDVAALSPDGRWLSFVLMTPEGLLEVYRVQVR